MRTLRAHLISFVQLKPDGLGPGSCREKSNTCNLFFLDSLDLLTLSTFTLPNSFPFSCVWSDFTHLISPLPRAPFYGSRINLSDPFASIFCHIASKSDSRRFGLIGLDHSQYIQREALLFFPAVHTLSLFSPEKSMLQV